MELFKVIVMLFASYKVPNGKLLKVKLEATGNQIREVKILGDFFLHPEETILAIEEALIDCKLDSNEIEKRIQSTLMDYDATLIGATPGDFSKTVMMAWESK